MRSLENQNNGNDIAAFVRKLWSMVESPSTDEVISWSKNGKYFVIKDESKFWYEILPVYYKHNNMSSFIRQLNMYGFRKVPYIHDPLEVKSEYQFMHPCFRKGKVELLNEIKRKPANTRVVASANDFSGDSQHISKVCSDINTLRSRQVHVDTALNTLKKENAALWREIAILRQKHQNQEQILNKLIQFLGSVVQQSRLGGVGLKRKSLMIHAKPSKKVKTKTDGPVIHELDINEIVMDDVLMDANTHDNVKVESPPSANTPSQGCSEEAPAEDNVNFDEFINYSSLGSEELFSELGLPEETNSIPSLEISEMFDDNSSIKLSNPDNSLLDSSAQDVLLSSLLNGSYKNNDTNTAVNSSLVVNDEAGQSNGTTNMSLATCDNMTSGTSINTIEDIDKYLGVTQNELEHIKKIFYNCSSVDTKALLQVFREMPAFGLTPNETPCVKSPDIDCTDVTPYDQDLIDFSNILDDGIDSTNFSDLPQMESLNTPEPAQLEPTFLSTGFKY